MDEPLFMQPLDDREVAKMVRESEAKVTRSIKKEGKKAA